MTRLSSAIASWGSTPAERRSAFGCDTLLDEGDLTLFRAVDVNAPTELTFRWICQLRVAPYSYDLLDNLGRRSPRSLTPGAEQLEVGQRVMTIFTLVAFEVGRSITLLTRSRLFGSIACTYRADAVTPDRSRIVVKMVAGSARSRWHRSLLRAVLGPGDLVMMRRQLLTLKRLSEASR